MLFVCLNYGSLPVQAHGTEYTAEAGKAIVIKSAYSGSEPFSFCEALVFAPGNTKNVFQKGRTDKNGFFAFVPDKPGDWTVKMNDGMGHAINASVTVNKELNVSGASGGSINFLQKLVMVMLFVWGSFGTAMLFRRKYSEKQ